MTIDAIILSKADTDAKRQMTQNTINSMLAGAGDHNINVMIVEQIEDVDYSGCTTYYKPEQFHYNKFLNFAAGKSNAEFILCANNDLIFQDGWLDELLKADYPIVSPHEPTDHRQSQITENESVYSNAVHFCGWCFMISRKLWEDIGGFDESVRFYCSDDVVIEQLKTFGIPPMVVKNSVVSHLISQTLSQESTEAQEKLMWDDVKIYNDKHNKEMFHWDDRYLEYLKRKNEVK